MYQPGSNNVIRVLACTKAHVFFEFIPHDENDKSDNINSGESHYDYARRLCKKYGFEAVTYSIATEDTYWSSGDDKKD